MKHLLPLLKHLPRPPTVEEGEPIERTRFNFTLWLSENIGGTLPKDLANWINKNSKSAFLASPDDKLGKLYPRVWTQVLDELGIFATEKGFVLLDDNVIEEVYEMAHSAAQTDDDLGINETPKKRTRKAPTPKQAKRANRRAGPVKKAAPKKAATPRKAPAKKTAAKPAPATNGSGRGRKASNRLIRATDTVKALELKEETPFAILVSGFGVGKRGKREVDVMEGIADTWEPVRSTTYHENPVGYLRGYVRSAINRGYLEVLDD